MLYKTAAGSLSGKGHVGLVLRVSEDGNVFNTLSGNESNRLKVGLRYKAQTTLMGFVSPYTASTNNDWERGTIGASEAPKGIGGTR